ncbi:hypothetical protein MRB53_034200 [Persea americana]|uniref:Uncharacterized protein n=1 Tax=Persea americana TaxID=3435 RepID=A0ACC2KXD0_PERAE|nr:hypothetical protein MRB53_034200 [Persea americana]
MQRKECFNLVRRIKQLVPMLEEVREFETGLLLAEAKACLGNLKKVFVSAKKLLRCCHDGSKIYLALESEAVMDRFHAIYEKLHQVLDGMPYDDEIGISVKVKEQVELMCFQLKRSKKQTDNQDIEFAMDMVVVFSKKDGRNADSAILERLAKRMDLCTIPDLGAETFAIKRLVNERSGLSSETIQQIIDVLNKFRQIAGMEETGLDDVTLPKTVEKCPCLLVPNDFLRPISLDIMVDPVIVATGQTYERSSIKNVDEGNKRLTAKEGAIPAVIEVLREGTMEARENSAAALFSLSMLNENRERVGSLNGIRPLVDLLKNGTIRGKKDAATALFNLSLNHANKARALEAALQFGVYEHVVEVAKSGTTRAKRKANALLQHMSKCEHIP